NGKLDRRALPAPEWGVGEEAYVGPRTPAEEVLAGIWAEVLGTERVGVGENFFELGGHSLLATRVVSRIREVLAVELPLRVLFEAPTVAGLAERVEALRRAEQPVLPPVVPTGRGGALPLSFAQERLWFLDRLQPGSAFYNVPAAVLLSGELDARALERALGEIVRRHEALRTVFAEVEGSPVQVVAPFGGFALPVEDLSGLEEGERAAVAKRRVAEDAARPFDLERGPLFRAGLLRLEAEEHVLLLCMHHVVSDGWSMGVLFGELSALYTAYREGRESPLPEPAVQYADYAAWQREQLEGEALERQVGYWKERLAGAPELLELPTDRARPAVQAYRGASEPIELSGELPERLQALARREGATLYMVLLGAFQVLLSKYAGSEDVVVGSPIAGRTRREVEGLIGFFVNTLVLRTDLSGDPGFRETLRRVREVTLGAYENQDVPFEKLVAELQPERSLSHSPLFQVLFTLEDVEDAEGTLPGLRLQGVEAEQESAKFDLSLGLAATPQGLLGELNYSTELFERDTVARMRGHLERVLQQVAEDPEVRLSGVELLGEAERAQVLEEWNRTEAAYPFERCVHQLFEAQAARTPDAVAVVFEEETLSYGALNARANRLAHHLRRLGVGPETRVGVCLPRAPELVAALLGVLKAGGAYVPLDPAYPRERLGHMLEDAAIELVLTESRLADRLPEGAADLLLLDRADLAAGCDVAPESGAEPENLSHVIFTSGSTGRPKGVMIRHASTVVLLHWLRESVTDEERSSVLFSTSINFDVSVAEVFGTLAWGGKLVLVENALELATVEEPVVYASMVPSAAAELLRKGGIPASVRTLNLGGEALPNPLAQGLYALGHVEKVGNLYGPTEDTTYSTYSVVERGGDRVYVGRPVAGTQAYVLDRHLHPVPVGVVGELYLAGDGLSRGYANHPELTAERYLPNPFEPAGARMYRVMDRVRWRADGVLEYFGRTDFQVKVRGFRIELGEVEAVMGRHPAVREAVAVVREDVPGDRRIVAYVTGAEPAAAELRAHASVHLPEYMVPSAFVVLETLPLTPNGKVDRKALPAPEYGGAEAAYVAPRTPAEEVLAGIWAEVLGTERVGVGESFFELGGHSLLATRVVSRIREVLSVELPLRVLFEAPTVAGLAERVEALRRAGQPVLPPVVPTERGGAPPLSFAQERLWFLDRLQPGSAFYNIPVALRLDGKLDAAALERALGEVVRRHEALRTVFAEVEGVAAQVVVPFRGFALPVEDLSGLEESERVAVVKRRAAEDAARPFDLREGPLFRAALLRLGAEEHALLLCMHHVVSDGWSMGVLFGELSALYGAYREGRESPLPPLAVQYADYAVWQREQLEGEALDRQVGYWKERLAGAPELLELPTDHPRPAVQTYRGASQPIELPGELLERLEALARREGATLYMVLLGAFQVLLSKYAGSEDVVVGSPIAGRTRREVEGLIGFFVNTLVLRTDVSGDPSFRAILGRVRESTLGAYENQDVPFEKLVAELQPERSLSHSPLFQVLFTLQNTGGAEGTLPGLRLRGVEAEQDRAKFDLSFDLAATPQGLFGELNYSTDLFERGTVARMLGHLERVLEQVAEDPDARLSGVELLGEAERAQVLEEWNRTEAEHPSDRCIHQLFEAQAVRTPDAVAVV
ncbi:MAG TPA: amino acid adenylation domain-containing protein, partial [Longimicrobiaceae bacterium]